MGETPSDRVYITKLPNDITEAKIKEAFGDYGTLKNCKVVSAGTAILTLATMDEAKWMVENLDGNMPEGITSPISVKFAKSGGNWGKGEGGGGGGCGGGGGWNAGGGGGAGPYGGKGMGGGMMGGMGMMGKGMMMGKGGSIQMLKQTLMNMGALPGGKGSKNRSDAQQLYIKGLPADTTDADLHEIFGPFGAIPPRGVKATLTPEGQCNGVGWVDFVNEQDAATAAQTLNGCMLADGSWLMVKSKDKLRWNSKGDKGGKGGEKKEDK